MLLSEVVSKKVGGKKRKGHHTFKKFHFNDKLPAFISRFIDANKLVIEEDSWNFASDGHTVYTNPTFMGDDFFITVDSTNIDGDYGDGDNPLNLSKEDLAIRSVVLLDIAKDEPKSKHYETHYKDDPTSCHFTESGKEPLKPDWLKSYSGPIMTVYKLVRTYFKWYGLQTWIEKKIVSEQRDYLLIFHRRLFCLMDVWHGMTLDELEEVEAETIERLNYLRQYGQKRGLGTQSPHPPAWTPKKKKAKRKAVVEQTDEPRVEAAVKAVETQPSFISNWMRPLVEEVVDNSRRRIIIRGFHRDLVVTMPSFRNDEPQEKIADEN